MALARIISRSRHCSRELALDLLDRGYTVEIVSPDAIPDSLADLELRVDEGPFDTLTATVEAHNGGHSTSLDFVHHLKAPMVDFKRRPSESSEPAISVVSAPIVPLEVARTEIAVESNLEGVSEAVGETCSETSETPADSWQLAELVESIPESKSVPDLPVHEVPAFERQAADSRAFEAKALESAVFDAPTKTTSLHDRAETIPEPQSCAPHPVQVNSPEVKPRSSMTRFGGSLRWSWRAAGAFAALLIAAAALGFGVKRIGGFPRSSYDSRALVSTDSSGKAGDSATPTETDSAKPMSLSARLVAAANGDGTRGSLKSEPSLVSENAVTAPAPNHPVAAGSAPESVKHDGSSAPRARSKPKAAVQKPGRASSHPEGDGLIARDTITYFDKSAKPIPVTLAHRRSHTSRKSGGVVAASTITYLNGKNPPKSDSAK